ncbi:MAG: hypothetical protein HY741_08645 [Chloroflexi bacterium]|nr:hypothetical protein [Chloroflexota bacterium]
MNIQLSNVRWLRVVLTAVLVVVLNYVLVTLLVTVYAFVLSFQARGAPDQAQITQFANQFAPWATPLLGILLTFGAAVWVARKVETAPQLHGWLVGLFVAIIGLLLAVVFGGAEDLFADLLWFVVTIVAGGVGGMLGARRKLQPAHQ